LLVDLFKLRQELYEPEYIAHSCTYRQTVTCFYDNYKASPLKKFAVCLIKL